MNKLVLLLLLLIPNFLALSTEYGNKSFSIKAANKTPIIDGKFSKEEWKHAANVSNFVERAPVVGRTPEYKTEVYVTYDAQYFYVAAIAYQSREQLSAKTLVQGSNVWDDDYFALEIDPSHRNKDAYYFQVNPNGVRQDGLVENREYINEWQSIWHAETSVEDDRWIVEYKIPFQSISFSADITDWGIQFRRRIANPNRQYFWNLNDTEGWGWYANQLGTVSGISNLDTGMGLDIRPAVTFKDFGIGQEPNNYKAIQPSLDLFYKLTPSLTAAVTLNTDFSGTDVDEQQVNLGRFSLFLPEKRDFFLQDAGVFEFGGLSENGRPFFSRRVGLSSSGQQLDIDAGLKLTGKVGDFNLGLLTVQQDNEVNGSTLLSVARGRYETNDSGYVGAIVTSGNTANNKQDILVGMDVRQGFKLVNGLNIDTNLWWQQVDNYQQPNNENYAYGFNASLPNDKYSGYINYMEVGENFNPSLGFVNRTGIRKFESELKYRNRVNNEHFNSISMRGQYTHVTNTDGLKLSERSSLRPIELEFANNDYTNLLFVNRFERVQHAFSLAGKVNIDAGDYTWQRYGIWYSMNDSRPYSAYFWHEQGGYFNGDRQSYRIGVDLKPNKFIYINADYRLNKMQFASTSFDTKVIRINANFAFNANWAWTNNIQYDNVSDKMGIFSRLKYEPQAGELYQVIISRGFTVDDEMSHFTSDFQDIVFKGVYTLRF